MTGNDRILRRGGGPQAPALAFAKYGAFLRTRLSGWVAYSLLDARRLQARNVDTAIQHARGPAPYDVNNALGRTNILDYEYNADYSARTERTSYYRRFIYVGATLTLH